MAANKQRDDGCQGSCHPSSLPLLSSQCLTLGSSFLVILSKMFARLQSIFLDPSVWALG
ncbi:hypothetical protein [Wolbachia endosymbiont (group A) of Anomoia purmunda]|uniref:hypothetical protein n=1 Tax=Wolbachia endosymbiont (group A) of Anomoia purmunda TaxID=2953978 RepID=UPI002230CD80|nr:hypothetical protein [Wolbachia endosymbiont (group A) of Anomoia purmunda]